MNILGIETATERLSTALIKDGTFHERHNDSRLSHCELLTGFISELVTEAGITMNDIEGIAVSLGPGSFTGLRIGISTAMGLAYGLGLKAVGVNTLMGLAWNSAPPGTLVCPLIDAKRSEVYTAIYRTGNDIPDVVIKPAAVPVAKLADMLRLQGEPITVTGPAAGQFRKTLEETAGASLSFVPSEMAQPSAVSIALVGSAMFNRNRGVTPSALKPVYLRRSDAEIARDNCRK
ncbi:tRNA (adenosine(37)-N6)-threonylcarbamoyltransferase complex dimerization subunit type 1 TsaB [Candidatus Latescibacterota bacterium]